MKYALEKMGQLVHIITGQKGNEGDSDKKILELIELSKCEKENIRVYLLRRSLQVKKEQVLKSSKELYCGKEMPIWVVAAVSAPKEYFVQIHGVIINFRGICLFRRV